MKTLWRLLLLGAVLLHAGCGLPDTYYLQPPSPGLPAQGPGYFQFSNPIHDTSHDINATFLGNELFYKFYPSDAVESNAYDPNNPSDASVQLLAKGFSPICLSTDHSPNRSVPLIAIDSALAAAGSSVIVNIQESLPFTPTDTNFVLESNPSVEISRKAVQGDFIHYKTFQDNIAVPGNFAPNDPPDIGPTLFDQMNASGLIYVVMYAISYGEIIGTQSPVRSSAVYLGYLHFTFTP